MGMAVAIKAAARFRQVGNECWPIIRDHNQWWPKQTENSGREQLESFVSGSGGSWYEEREPSQRAGDHQDVEIAV